MINITYQCEKCKRKIDKNFNEDKDTLLTFFPCLCGGEQKLLIKNLAEIIIKGTRYLTIKKM